MCQHDISARHSCGRILTYETIPIFVCGLYPLLHLEVLDIFIASVTIETVLLYSNFIMMYKVLATV